MSVDRRTLWELGLSRHIFEAPSGWFPSSSGGDEPGKKLNIDRIIDFCRDEGPEDV